MSNVIKFPQAQKQAIQPSLEEALEELNAFVRELEAAPCTVTQMFRDIGFSEFEARRYAKIQHEQSLKDCQLREERRAEQKRKNVILNKQKQKQFKINNKAKRKAWKAQQAQNC